MSAWKQSPQSSHYNRPGPACARDQLSQTARTQDLDICTSESSPADSWVQPNLRNVANYPSSLSLQEIKNSRISWAQPRSLFKSSENLHGEQTGIFRQMEGFGKGPRSAEASLTGVTAAVCLKDSCLLCSE